VPKKPKNMTQISTIFKNGRHFGFLLGQRSLMKNNGPKVICMPNLVLA